MHPGEISALPESAAISAVPKIDAAISALPKHPTTLISSPTDVSPSHSAISDDAPPLHNSEFRAAGVPRRKPAPPEIDAAAAGGCPRVPTRQIGRRRRSSTPPVCRPARFPPRRCPSADIEGRLRPSTTSSAAPAPHRSTAGAPSAAPLRVPAPAPHRSAAGAPSAAPLRVPECRSRSASICCRRSECRSAPHRTRCRSRRSLPLPLRFRSRSASICLFRIDLLPALRVPLRSASNPLPEPALAPAACATARGPAPPGGRRRHHLRRRSGTRSSRGPPSPPPAPPLGDALLPRPPSAAPHPHPRRLQGDPPHAATPSSRCATTTRAPMPDAPSHFLSSWCRSDARVPQAQRSNGSQADLLSRFMKLTLDPSMSEQQKTQFLRDTAVGLILAGKDLIAVTLTWFFYMICKHPTVEARILEELKGLQSSTWPGDFSVFECDALRSAIYLQAALLETLRLFPCDD